MRKQLAIAGLSAGLVVGGAAGFAFTSGTGFAGAQSSTTTQPDDADERGSDERPADRPDRGERLGEILAPLVDDGTLTQEQADKVVETLTAAGPAGRGGPGGRGRHGHARREGVDAAATALGMTAEELRTELRSGSTIAQVAEAKGVELQTVIDAMVAEVKEELDEAVTAGRITQEKADERLASATERITERVNRTGKPDDARRGDRGERGGTDDTAADESTTTTTEG